MEGHPHGDMQTAGEPTGKPKATRPKIAIVDNNTLAVIGLEHILQNVMPIMTIDTFGSFEELQESNPDTYVHFSLPRTLSLPTDSFSLTGNRRPLSSPPRRIPTHK